MIEYTVTVDEKGTRRWHLNGELHREDGPALEKVDGYKAWYQNDQLHREDGPACEFSNGYKEWFLNGKRHREDGPAVEWINGSKEWWLNGDYLTEEEFNERTQFKTIIMDGKEIKLSIESFNELKKQLT
tara:strand:+ start:176 stop:562 length:387 start_codon:yes stop_codon:yes gene_type:complete